MLVKRVTSLIDAGRFSQAETELANYFSPPWFLSSLRGRSLSLATNARDDSLSLLRSVAAVYRNDINSALGFIPNAQNEKYQEFRVLLSELDHTRDELQNTRSELFRLRGWLDNFPTQYDSIAKAFGELFSLTPVRYEGESRSLPIYESGVLQGLPQLANLSDDIPDFPALAGALQAAGGQVTLEAADQHEAFLRRVDELRTTLAGAQEEREDTFKRIAELEALERAGAAQRVSFERELKINARAFVNDSLRLAWDLF